jgi:hypothetical protein
MNSVLSSLVASVALVAACGFTVDALASREQPVTHTRAVSVAAPDVSPDAPAPGAATIVVTSCCRTAGPALE